MVISFVLDILCARHTYETSDPHAGPVSGLLIQPRPFTEGETPDFAQGLQIQGEPGGPKGIISGRGKPP